MKEAAGIEKGSGIPNKDKVAKLSRIKIEEIAKRKMPDLNANDLEGAMKIINPRKKALYRIIPSKGYLTCFSRLMI